MFYSSQLLSRKTPLGICWLASHSESKRLKRAQVFEVSISQSCDSIINPEAPLALRLSGQLLLGVVRIYQRKLTFLETDAKNAIDGLQRKEGASQNVDLPDGGTAPELAITLPDTELGLGGELFPSFAISDTPGGLIGAGGAFGGRLSAGAESLTLADDISEVFGSTRWTASEERFDIVGGDDIDRRFTAELERLRSQAAVENPRDADFMFYDGGDDSFGAPMDEIMEPPPDDLFAMDQPAAGPTPGSIGGGVPLSGGADIRFTPPSLGFDALPDFGTGGTAPGAAPTPVNGRQQRKKKKAHIDVGPDGMPATQLTNDEIRKLLNNSAPLLKQRGLNSTEARSAEIHLDPLDVKAQSAAARESFLYRPACFTRLAPETLEVFNNALGAAAGGKVPGAQRPKSRAARPDAEEPFGVSPGEAEAAVPSMGHVGDDNGASPAPSWGGGFDDGPAYSDDYHQDPIEASQEHQGPHNAPGSVSRGSAPALDLAAVPRSTISGDAPSFGGDVDGSSGSGVPGYARDGFTARTKVVLEHLQHRFGPSSGSKRRHPASATPGPAADPIALDGIVAGKSRLEACRWFFEALVLRNKGYVDLEQAEPYGEIAIRPLQQLMDGGPVPGTSARPTPASAFPSQGE